MSKEEYKVDARIWTRESTQEWVLELSGAINDQSFICRHTEPLSVAPEDVAGLPSHYVSTKAAANNEAEEGGLPALPEEIEVGGEGWDFEDFKSQKTFSVDHMHEYALKAIAADRASRQVANKAEVEGIASSEIPEGWPTEIWLNAGDEDLAPFSEYDELSWCSLPQGENDIRYVREDLLATPPATTGASTARDQALEEAALICEGVNNYTNPMTANDCADSIRALKGSIGASTVLTDERMPVMYAAKRIDNGEYGSLLHRSEESAYQHNLHNGPAAPKYTVVAMREVAEQAGQVAVPSGWIAVARIQGEETSVAFRDLETAKACSVDGEPIPFWIAEKNRSHE